MRDRCAGYLTRPAIQYFESTSGSFRICSICGYNMFDMTEE